MRKLLADITAFLADIITLVVLALAFGSVGFNLVSKLVPQDLTNQLWFRAIAVLLVLTLISAIYLLARRQINSQKLENENRQRMLASVRQKWITSYLESYKHSFYSEKLIPMKLRKQTVGQRTRFVALSDAIITFLCRLTKFLPFLYGLTKFLSSHFTRYLEQPDENAAELFSPDAVTSLPSITQIYDVAQHRLLIFGEPGSGKTTQLLILLKDLLARAEKDDTQPIPIVVNLSSWVIKRLPLAEWLIEELNAAYDVPTDIGKSWVQSNQITLLLDGLDEVCQAYLPECIEAINDCLGDLCHRVDCVVCCQKSVYLEQDRRMHVQTAAFIEPLTLQQIDIYLSDSNNQLDSLQEALHTDLKLQELALVPMNLDMLAAVSRGKSAPELLEILTSSQPEQKLCEAYVQNRLEDPRIEKRYESSQVKVWLGWLAKTLKESRLHEFSLERMQPEWLADEQSFRRYDRIAIEFPRFLLSLASGLYIGLLLGSIRSGILGGVIFGLLITARPVKRVNRSIRSWASWRWSIIRGVLVAIFFWLFGPGLLFAIQLGLFTGPFLGQLRRLEIDIELISDSWQARNSWCLRVGKWVFSILIGVYIGVLFTIILGIFENGILILFSGLLVGLLTPIIRRVKVKIGLAEIVNRSGISRWRGLRRGLLEGIVFGIIVTGLSLALKVGWDVIRVMGLPNGGLLFPAVFAAFFFLQYAFSFGLLLGLIRGLMNGLHSDMLDPRSQMKPDRGIRRTLRNSMCTGLVNAVFIFMLLLVGLQLLVIIPLAVLDESQVIWYALVGGLLGGMITAFYRGGSECIKYIILRLLLWRNKHTPWNYIDFLDYACQKQILRKAGGGYIFWYPPLRDYFATLYTLQIEGRFITRNLPKNAREKIEHVSEKVQ